MIARAALLSCLCGCAFDAGGPFATVEATLDARLVTPPDRDLGDGWQKLASDYQVRFSRATVELGAVELVSAGGASGVFDPADPPPGFTLCHNGHCHTDDGRLVSYADVAAQLAGGGAAPVVLRLDAAGEVDLLAGVDRALGCAGGSCDLPQGTVGLLRMPVNELVLEGRVRDPVGRFSGERSFSVTVTDASLNASTSISADRASAPDIELALRAPFSSALLDDHDFAAGGDLAASVRAALADTALETTIER